MRKSMKRAFGLFSGTKIESKIISALVAGDQSIEELDKRLKALEDRFRDPENKDM